MENADATTGLVLIQIDGLAQDQLLKAIERGRMPFLRRLLSHERYRVRTMYSGLPSTTPAVQGELFYGQAQAVPAFSYLPRGAREPVYLNDSEQAAKIESILSQAGEGLLAGGSAQSNIYSAGAAEPRFCAAAMGNGQAAQSGARMLGAMAYSGTLFRAVGQTCAELGVAMFDFAKALFAGRLVRPELRIIPSRVAVGVLLRDAITSAACDDATKGLPIIQLNYLGYDEKAHCRGPGSRFAHRSLRGIDRCIRQIWRAAMRSKTRPYELWVYSDHGQEHVEPYEKLTGQPLQDAVLALWNRPGLKKLRVRSFNDATTTARAQWFRGRKKNESKATSPTSEPDEQPPLQVIAVGPLGYVYLHEPATPERLRDFARRMVREAQVPIVIQSDGDTTRAFTAQGEWTLPEDSAAVLGDSHPFRTEAAADLVRLCRHPEAGQLMICGWRTDAQPITFVQEFGAHGGPGAAECSAFVLAPEDSPIPWSPDASFRPSDLRTAVQTLRGVTKKESQPARPSRAPRRTLRVMTYNVHSCRGVDERLSPERIARIIEQSDVDVAALQELDIGRARSGQIDQAHRIAELLGWNVHFSPAISRADEHYGDAILSRLPMELVRTGTLPGNTLRPHLEPRGALWVRVLVDNQPVQILNTHLGLLRAERRQQVTALLSADWLGHEQCQDPVVLCGDFNALPRSSEFRRLASQLVDVQHGLNGRRKATFSSSFPLLAIDHIFVRGVRVVGVESPRSTLVRKASDHLPLVAEFSLDDS
jgi:endonuclease/exonuclease/phosphatase family metal-dependent hydrolase